LMPADIIGTNIITEDPDTGRRQFEFQKGPLFSQIILADEINRATPKTQSAMLEAMQEHSITVGGTHYRLDEPFLVLATQNPIEQEGTYPLPEAQVDRFLLKVKIGYPSKEEERDIMRRNISGEQPKVHKVVSPSALLRAREVMHGIYMDEKIEQYIIDIVFATRAPAEYGLKSLAPLISYGASPRASIAMALAARALAFLRRRGYVIPEDVRNVCSDVLRHRIGMTYEAEAENISPEDIIEKVLHTIEVP
ncbi:MAG: MoxR family ATPase, partial [Saprospiraceae bacterium]|nr:MoxR family ATPase [Saprospiraceae bacterium]